MESTYAYDSPGTISAVFLSRDNADRAYKALLRRGYKEDNISVLMSDETLNKHLSESSDHSEPESTPAAEPDSAALDTSSISSFFYSLTMIKLPALGIAIAGPIVARFTKTKSDTAGPASDMMTDRPDEQRNTTYDGIREGGIIISVDPKSLAERDAIVQDFRRFDGQDILTDDGYSQGW